MRWDDILLDITLQNQCSFESGADFIHRSKRNSVLCGRCPSFDLLRPKLELFTLVGAVAHILTTLSIIVFAFWLVFCPERVVPTG